MYEDTYLDLYTEKGTLFDPLHLFSPMNFLLEGRRKCKGLDTQGDKGKEWTIFSFSRWFLSTKGTSLCLVSPHSMRHFVQIHSSVHRMAIYISDVYTMIRAVLGPIWVQLNASTTNKFEKKMYITALSLKEHV